MGNSLKQIQLKSGEILFHKGDAPDFAYLVESGQIDVLINDHDEQSAIVSVSSGEILGEIAVLDNLNRTATAKAKTDCALYIIDRNQLKERIDEIDPIIHSLLNCILQRFRTSLESYGVNTTDNQIIPSSNNHIKLRKNNQLENKTLEKIRLETQLLESLSEKKLDVKYQPILATNSKNIVSYEALIRWNHTELGSVSPMHFVKLAEETSLILKLGEFVINAACKTVAKFISEGITPVPSISINVSPKQLIHPEFFEYTSACIKKYELPQGSIHIEITESHAIKFTKLTEVIARLHEQGIQVSLDDFGTGFSNLAQVHELDFDLIKIDKLFIKNVASNPKSYTIVAHMLRMCQELNAKVLAEGVEDEATLNILQELGCDLVQGFYFGKPLTLEQILNQAEKP